MAARRFLLITALLLVALAGVAMAGGGGAGHQVPLSWELGLGEGSVGDEDFGYGDADDAGAVARRVLQAGGYIGYGALRRDSVPCSVRGASYYNCRPGAEANPYSRGCSAITRCRG